jgi:DNA polymerase
MTKSEQIRIIHEEIIALKESPLYEYRTQNNFFPVIGEGSLDAKMMFVGEAPGRNEAKTGKPFCGAAGKILDQLLEHIKITRNLIYITNIVKDRPPENRDPTKEEIKIYGPFLDRQIEIIKPKIIVALGRYSMGYIMEKFGLNSHLAPIGQLHGRSFDAKTTYGNINVVIQYHPCMGVYNPNNIPNLKKDMEILTKINNQNEKK